MNPIEQYIHDRDEQVKMNMKDRDLHMYASRFTEVLVHTNYTKNFTWMGVPILQYPTDLMVMQELIWKIKPDYIIETGVAFGGMTKFYASMLDHCGGQKVISIDIDIREHTRDSLHKQQQLVYMIDLIEGSSIDQSIFDKVIFSIDPEEPIADAINEDYNILVSLDSLHTHDHVLQELRLYSPLVSVGSYIVAYDTAIEFYGHLDKNKNQRPWGPGNNPYTAVQQFLKENDNFIVDKEIEQRVLITAAPGGYLKRIK